MSIITAAAARDHLEVSEDVSETKLAPLIAAAEQALADYLGRPLIGDGGWTDAEAVPANIVHAIKLILADLFDDRNTPVRDMTSVANLCGRYVVTSFA